MYYVLGRSWARSPARRPDRGSYDRQGRWWDDGQTFDPPPRTPIEVRLDPFEPRSPDESPALPAYIPGLVPLFRDDLVAAFRSAGVDNLDVYDARLFDPDNGQSYTNYKAVNIIGMLAAADMTNSVATVHDGIPLIDVSFDSLVVDPAKTFNWPIFRLAENNSTILVHQRVRDHLLRLGFDELDFYRPQNVAL